MGRTFKSVAISYYPAQTSAYKFSESDRGLMLNAGKIIGLCTGIATTLQVDELDKLTNAFGKNTPPHHTFLTTSTRPYPAHNLPFYSTVIDSLYSERGTAKSGGYEYDYAACKRGESGYGTGTLTAHMARS